ncbi:YciI family protein [Nocardia abscessus]|uniref:YciI family protein n=1 Tax=Nocardia abscessus TaxID=120957 RepID=UPI002454B76E|nr:hypothetical protein [Nocardia abscessus]
MFIVLLKFSSSRAEASQHMAGHQQWIDSGFSDGVFLLVGGIKPGVGGAVPAHNISSDELKQRVAEDPFAADVVSAEILEITPGQADDRLSFLLG